MTDLLSEMYDIYQDYIDIYENIQSIISDAFSGLLDNAQNVVMLKAARLAQDKLLTLATKLAPLDKFAEDAGVTKPTTLIRTKIDALYAWVITELSLESTEDVDLLHEAIEIMDQLKAEIRSLFRGGH